MKRVYIASDPIDAELVAGLLMAGGIRAVVFNDHLWPIPASHDPRRSPSGVGDR